MMETGTMVALMKAVTEAVKGFYAPEMVAALVTRGIYMSEVGVRVGVGFGVAGAMLLVLGAVGRLVLGWRDDKDIPCWVVGGMFVVVAAILIPVSIASAYQWLTYPDIMFVRQVLGK